ncbi:DUF6757 family protein [Halocatena salina]|uniref:Uncharacterized protein n=1 Tax=Halocatena salina TaxID=2934340 RepID=A0A8U0A0P0_9EURY|nr:DUF6757 family protein [Halocatena salina]UPM41998.1 hypothetical protein MW046_08450 [Halocatena salina]
MQCHYCETEAAMSVEKDGVKVGLCQQHFRARFEELQSEGWLEELQEKLNTERVE